jgi:hypothetical protein
MTETFSVIAKISGKSIWTLYRTILILILISEKVVATVATNLKISEKSTMTPELSRLPRAKALEITESGGVARNDRQRERLCAMTGTKGGPKTYPKNFPTQCQKMLKLS